MWQFWDRVLLWVHGSQFASDALGCCIWYKIFLEIKELNFPIFEEMKEIGGLVLILIAKDGIRHLVIIAISRHLWIVPCIDNYWLLLTVNSFLVETKIKNAAHMVKVFNELWVMPIRIAHFRIGSTDFNKMVNKLVQFKSAGPHMTCVGISRVRIWLEIKI